LNSKTIFLRDINQSIVCLLSSEAAPFIKEQLISIKSILEHLYPSSFQPTISSTSKFKNIHLDIYNRFSEDVSVDCYMINRLINSFREKDLLAMFIQIISTSPTEKTSITPKDCRTTHALSKTTRRTISHLRKLSRRSVKS
jgi:hypothetical protein